MSTRDITFTAEERRVLLHLADQAWQIINAKREQSVGRLEAAALSDQQMIEKIQDKLR